MILKIAVTSEGNLSRTGGEFVMFVLSQPYSLLPVVGFFENRMFIESTMFRQRAFQPYVCSPFWIRFLGFRLVSLGLYRADAVVPLVRRTKTTIAISHFFHLRVETNTDHVPNSRKSSSYTNLIVMCNSSW